MPSSTIAPSCASPSSSSTPPVESIHVWCQQPRSASQRAEAVPHDAAVAAPVLGQRAGAERASVIEFRPMWLPSGSCTSHSPSQKSNACAMAWATLSAVVM